MDQAGITAGAPSLRRTTARTRRPHAARWPYSSSPRLRAARASLIRPRLFHRCASSNPYFKFIQKLKDLGSPAAARPAPTVRTRRLPAAIWPYSLSCPVRGHTVQLSFYPLFHRRTPSNAFFRSSENGQAGITAGCAPSQYCPNET